MTWCNATCCLSAFAQQKVGFAFQICVVQGEFEPAVYQFEPAVYQFEPAVYQFEPAVCYVEPSVCYGVP